MVLGRVCSDTITWGSDRVLLLFPPVILRFEWVCSRHVSAANTTLTISHHPQISWLLSWMAASSVRFCPVCSSHGARGQGGHSPFSSKYYSSQIPVPGGSGLHGPARAEGTEMCGHQGTSTLEASSQGEYILKSSKWLLLHMSAARGSGLGSGGSSSCRRAGTTHFRVPCRRAALGARAAHSSAHILTHFPLDFPVDCSVVYLQDHSASGSKWAELSAIL